jgi:Zn-finger nucleic acid-binding protein
MDFTAVNRFTIAREPSHRQCPDCAIQLETVRVDTGAGLFAIERCPQCYGLFFDVGEVQAFLEASVSPAFAINLREIATINEERGNFDRPIRYIKCPECGAFMNRINYGTKSGVVVDQCKEHGMWLDNGELVHLMEWKKAGGELLPKHEAPASREPKEYQRPYSSFPMATPRQETSIAADVVSVVGSILLDIF